MTRQEQQYAALAPLMSLAGVFAHPAASTVLPLILYFIFNWRDLSFARQVALRTADLAFSIQLFLMLASILLAAYVSFNPMPARQIQGMMRLITMAALLYMIVSLVIATIQAFRGRSFSHILSLKIAERLLNLSRRS